MIFKFRVAYVQANGNAINKLISFVYTTNKEPTVLNIGSAIPGGVTTYNNYQDAVTAFGHDLFLAHIQNNNIVTESYVGFVYNNNDYYLRGGVNESSLTTKPIYEANKAALINAFGSSNCSVDLFCGTNCLYTECSASGFLAFAGTDGYVDASDGSYACSVNDVGTSACGVKFD